MFVLVSDVEKRQRYVAGSQPRAHLSNEVRQVDHHCPIPECLTFRTLSESVDHREPLTSSELAGQNGVLAAWQA